LFDVADEAEGLLMVYYVLKIPTEFTIQKPASSVTRISYVWRRGLDFGYC
jgi:hypothetical protein